MESFRRQKILSDSNSIEKSNNNNKYNSRKRKHQEILYNIESEEKDDCKNLSKKLSNLQIEKHFKINKHTFKSNIYKENSKEKSSHKGK